MYGLIQDVSFRLVVENDINDLQALYKECFPVSYPDSWFSDLTKNKYLIPIVAVSQGHVIGVLVAKFTTLKDCNSEDRRILDVSFPLSTSLAYIMSLGVTKSWRSQGIASKLLNAFVRYASGSHYLERGAMCAVPLLLPTAMHDSLSSTTGNLPRNHDNNIQNSPPISDEPMASSQSATTYSSLSDLIDLLPACPPTSCAIYLHVLRTNFHARRFYENRGFRCLLIQQGCYSIAGQPADGCTYVMHMNGGFSRKPLLDLHPTLSRMAENIQYAWLPSPVSWILQLVVRFGQAVLCRIYPAPSTVQRPQSNSFYSQIPTNHYVSQSPPRASLCNPQHATIP